MARDARPTIRHSNERVGTRAAFNKSAIADNEVVAAVSGKKIRVLGWQLVVVTANTLTWKSDAVAISSAYPLQAGVWEPLLPFQQYETVAGEALNLALSGATQVIGDVWYELVG